MKRTTTLLSAAALALTMPLSVNAQVPGEDFLNNWDYDGDGQVTLAEVLERRADLFDGFDADENGVLSEEEMADHNAMRDAMQSTHERPETAGGGWGRQGGGFGRGMGMGPQGGGQRGPMMQQPGYGYGQPQGGWGYGQPQGFGYGQPQGFGYGQPQGFGYGAGPGWGPQQGMMQPGWGPNMGPRGGMGGQPGGWGQPGAQPGTGPQPRQGQMEAGLDANGDGQISRDEFVNAGKAWLPRFDRNGDGVVDASDFPAAPQN